MKIVNLYGIRDIRLEEAPKPKPSKGEIVLKVKCDTTCGTDVKTYRRGYPSIKTYPVPFGHGECAGDIEEIGLGVSRFKAGDRVTIHNSAPCFSCYWCRRNQFEICENYVEVVGGYQEYLRIPERIVNLHTFHIPDDLDYEEACQLEPFSCAVHGNDRSRIRVGDSVGILGSGPQGLYHLQLAKIAGATKVIVIDLVDYRLEVARKLGADYTINPSREKIEDTVKKLTEGRGVDVVIEAVGRTETWEQAIKLVRNGGTVNEYAGAEPGSSISVSTEKLHYGQITLTGTNHTSPYHVRLAWDLIKNRSVQMKPIVTHHMSLDEIHKAFDILTTSQTALKIAIHP